MAHIQANIKLGISGFGAMNKFVPLDPEYARRLIKANPKLFVKYEGNDGLAARDFTDHPVPVGTITHIPVMRNGRKEYLKFRRLVNRHSGHNDSKQAMIGRCVYWLGQHVLSEPVTKVTFELASGDEDENTSVVSNSNDLAEKYWYIFTAAFTATGAETANRAHLKNASSYEYAEYPDNGSPDVGLSLTSGDTLTVNWQVSVDGTPNATSNVGNFIPNYLTQALASAKYIGPPDTMHVSYDATATWKTASAVKTSGGGVGYTDTTVVFQGTFAAHGEGSIQTIDTAAIGLAAAMAGAPTVDLSYGYDATCSASWADGETKTVTATITLADA